MKPAPSDKSANCIFCRIASGELEADEVFRNESVVAFLDVRPIRVGHVQIIPVEHYSTFDHLPPELSAEILWLGQRIASAQKRLYQVERVAFLFTGGDIPHVHAHVVPMFEKTDITSRRYIKDDKLSWGAIPIADDKVLRDTAAELASALGDDAT